jgi:hypothetical protein
VAFHIVHLLELRTLPHATDREATKLGTKVGLWVRLKWSAHEVGRVHGADGAVGSEPLGAATLEDSL